MTAQSLIISCNKRAVCQAVGKVCIPAGQRLPFLSPSPQGSSGPQQSPWCSLLQGGSPRIHRGRPFTAEQILWGHYSPFTAVGGILSGSHLGNSSLLTFFPRGMVVWIGLLRRDAGRIFCGASHPLVQGTKCLGRGCLCHQGARNSPCGKIALSDSLFL